jgi:hypothetical protein
MTMHQLYYTSCEDGLEGIQGFQISAMTPGAPKPLVELAVRASAYEVGPGLAAQVGGADLSAFPVAFGYVPSGPAATLFQSRYTGSDFTGRTGNYFAHALLLEDTERELAGTLPIDMWRSSTWVHTRQNGTRLPSVDAIAPGGTTTAATVRQFLSGPDQTGRLPLMASAVQRALAGGRGRVVLVVPDDQSAALWLAALCRSFPRALGLGISFVTYTARPEDSGVLVSCTTPDVHLPAYGDFAVVDMTAASSNDEPTRYAALMARLWAAGDVASAVLPANRVSPPLTAAELDAFAVLVECEDGSAAPRNATEPLLLDAATLAGDRARGMLSDAGWERLAGLLGDAGGPVDLTRWSDLVQKMTHRGDPVPGDLLSAYYVAALTDPGRLWLPQLDDAQLEHVATRSVLPAITRPESGVLLDRLAEQASLCEATARALERRLTVQDELVPLVTTLAPRAAQLLRQRRPEGPVATLAELVLARAGQGDRIAALSRAAARGEWEWRRLGEVLWPEDPSTQEAERALRTLHIQVLTDTRLLDRIVARVRSQIDQDELGPTHTRLVDALLGPQVASGLSPTDVAMLEATKLVGHFRQATPKGEAGRMVGTALGLCRSLPPSVCDRLLASLAGFILRADAEQHRELLEVSLGAAGGRFLTAYRDQACAHLAKASPNRVAPVIVVWWSLSDTRTRQQLVNETLVTALRRRRGKQLDKIGSLLRPATARLAVEVPAPSGSWSGWWKGWRSKHQRRSLLSVLGLGGGR